MVLTTPVPQDKDIVIPGENWFLYWNTASSLWDVKLQFFRPGERILVPINWSFHSETGDDYDFGENRPETDLSKLCMLADKYRLKLSFLIPIGPAPFMANGGVPHLLARSRARDRHGISYAIPDTEGRVYGLYSFYDNRIFKAYRKFCTNFAQYLKNKKLSNDVYGIESCFFDGTIVDTYFADTSTTFDQAFEKFLQVKKGQDASLETISIKTENDFKIEFEQNIKCIYSETAQEAIHDNWEGIKNIVFVGGNSDSLLRNVFTAFDSTQYVREIFSAISFGHIPSSIVLPKNLKQKNIGKIFDQIVTQSLVVSNFGHDLSDGDNTTLVPLHFFKFKYSQLQRTVDKVRESGFGRFSEQFYPWSLLYSPMNEVESNVEGNIFFYSAEDLSESDFKKMLNLFINGASIFLDKDNLSDEMLKRWNVFLLENNLSYETINFHILLSNVSLGDGRVILYSEKELRSLDFEKKIFFWNKLISTFALKHILIEQVDGISHFWRTRKTCGNELRYEEVRRLSLFNSTSYKKKLKVTVGKEFKVIKFVDEQNTQFRVNANVIDLEMLPDSSVSIDFGLLP